MLPQFPEFKKLQLSDIEDVQRYTRPVPNMPQAVLRQAQETVKAIESR